MEVKPGYKVTELGIIPDAWDIERLGECLEIPPSYGVNAAAVPYSERLPVYLRITDITEDGRFLPDPRVCVNSQLSHNYYLTEGDIVFARTGASVGKSYRYNPADGQLVYAGFLIRLRPDPKKLLPAYVAAYVNTGGYWRWVRLMSMRSGQPGINAREYAQLQIPVPPLPEQRAIAAAMSDLDGLLDALDRLITKKRDLKQAAMQQLLTGQTRLPNFRGEWKMKTLREAALITTGINKPISEMGSGALYVTVQDLYHETSIRTSRLGRIKVTSAEIDTKGLAVGDIVFGKSSVKRDGIGYPSQFLGCEEPVVFSGFTYRARARRSVSDPTFLFYALRTGRTRRWVIENSQASALTNINQTIADAIPIELPPTLSEQIAIAGVLSDMDAELSALEARREKTRALRQAMMQELLTGRTQLVETQVTDA